MEFGFNILAILIYRHLCIIYNEISTCLSDFRHILRKCDVFNSRIIVIRDMDSAIACSPEHFAELIPPYHPDLIEWLLWPW